MEQTHQNQLIFITGNIPSLGQFGKLEKMKLISKTSHVSSRSPERFSDKNSNVVHDSEITGMITSAELRRRSLLETRALNNYEMNGRTSRQNFFEKESSPRFQDSYLFSGDTKTLENRLDLDKKFNFERSNTMYSDPICSPIRSSISIDFKNKSNSSPLGRNNTNNLHGNEETCYWEKNFLIPNNHLETLHYNFYALDLKTNAIFCHDQEFEVNLNEDITLLSHIWSPRNLSPGKEKKKLITLSPLKIRKEGNETKIELGNKIPNRFERKINLVILYNAINFLSDYREITSEISIGKNISIIRKKKRKKLWIFFWLF